MFCVCLMCVTPYITRVLQNEKAFQKQRGQFMNTKKVILGQVKKDARFVRNVGLGFKTPREVSRHFSA